MTLAVTVHQEGEKPYPCWALNEVSVEKAARERMLEVAVEIDGKPLSAFGCDGIVVSTPTGSTAYAFSLGGPVIWPDVEAILMVPNAAHALFSRPIVVSPTSRLAVEVIPEAEGHGIMWCDGRRQLELRPGARIEVTRSDVPVRLARLNASPFTDRLVAKFDLSVARLARQRPVPLTGALAAVTLGEGVFEEVRIQGVGVIDDAVLELSPGLNVVTGETGAGKTMVVSGLGLLLGMRADSGLVRAGRRSAVVEGVVSVPEGHPALARAREAGADVSEGLLLARTVGADGRSRAHVGGRSTPGGVLTEIGETLVAVHGQADQWRLRQGDQHREVLDGFGGEPVAAAAGGIPGDLRRPVPGASAERDRLRQLAHERAREIDVLQAGLERIEALDPQPGEDVALRAEDERLAHADGLRLAAAQAHAYLVGDEGYASDGAAAVVDALAAARAALAPVTDHDSALRELEGRVAELAYLAADLAADLSSYLADVDVDPARLAEVQQRRADLTGLTRRYGDSVDDVLAWGKEAAATLTDLLGADDRVHELDAETARLRRELGGHAAALSAARQVAADDFGRRVTDELAHLAMGGAVVTVAVASRDDPDGPRGRRPVAALDPVGRRRRRDPPRLGSGEPGPHGGQGRLRRRAVTGHAGHRGGRAAPRRYRPSSSTRWTPGSAAEPRWTSARGWRRWPGRPRSSSSPTWPRWRPSPTAISWSARATTAWSRPATWRSSTATNGSRSCPG